MPGTAPTILAAIGIIMMLSVFRVEHKSRAQRVALVLVGMTFAIVGIGVEVVLYLAEHF
jgi:uncharacterized protein (UPF0212 family)